MRRAILALGVAAMILGSTNWAQAAIPPMLRPGTHPWFAAGKIGGGLKVRDAQVNCGGWGNACAGLHQFMMGAEIGMHFSGKAEGPALSFVDFMAGFGSDYGWSHWSIQIGPRFFWDIPIIQGLGFYLSPGLLFGLGAAGSGAPNDITRLAVNVQVTFDGKLMLGDRGYVFMRPFSLDFQIYDERRGTPYPSNWNYFLRWDILFGGGVTF